MDFSLFKAMTQSLTLSAIGLLPVDHAVLGQIKTRPDTAVHTDSPSMRDIAQRIVQANRGLKPVLQTLDMNNAKHNRQFLKAHPNRLEVVLAKGYMTSLQSIIDVANDQQKDWIILATDQDINTRYALSVEQAQEMQAIHTQQQHKLNIVDPLPVYLSPALEYGSGAHNEYDVVNDVDNAIHTRITLGDLARQPLLGWRHMSAHEAVHHRITTFPDILPGARCAITIPLDIKLQEERIADTDAEALVDNPDAIFVGLGRQLCAPCVYEKPEHIAVRQVLRALRRNKHLLSHPEACHDPVYDRLKDQVMRARLQHGK